MGRPLFLSQGATLACRVVVKCVQSVAGLGAVATLLATAQIAKVAREAIQDME